MKNEIEIKASLPSLQSPGFWTMEGRENKMDGYIAAGIGTSAFDFQLLTSNIHILTEPADF